MVPSLINACVTGGFGRAMNSGSSSAAGEPSSESDCKYGHFQNELR